MPCIYFIDCLFLCEFNVRAHLPPSNCETIPKSANNLSPLLMDMSPPPFLSTTPNEAGGVIVAYLVRHLHITPETIPTRGLRRIYPDPLACCQPTSGTQRHVISKSLPFFRSSQLRSSPSDMAANETNYRQLGQEEEFSEKGDHDNKTPPLQSPYLRINFLASHIFLFGIYVLALYFVWNRDPSFTACDKKLSTYCKNRTFHSPYFSLHQTNNPSTCPPPHNIPNS